VGLPDGLTFKKPSSYGARQMRRIAEHQDDIVFVLDNNTIVADFQEKENVLPPKSTGDEIVYKSLLQKICGEEISKRIIGGGPKVKEEEVEVINLQHDQNEQLALHGECASYFEKDAWIAAGHNLTHFECVSGIVLPVYT
jgi:hypothetical protein